MANATNVWFIYESPRRFYYKLAGTFFMCVIFRQIGINRELCLSKQKPHAT